MVILCLEKDIGSVNTAADESGRIVFAIMIRMNVHGLSVHRVSTVA